MESLLVTVTALVVSLAIIPLMVRLAPALRMVDQPSPRKVHLHPVPRVGGWGIVLGALVTTAFWLPPGPATLAFMAGGAVLLIGGALDDSVDLRPRTKLLIQGLAAAPVVIFAGLVVSEAPLLVWEMPMPPPVAAVLSGIGLVACINATNTSDGLDGLAGGETLLTLCGALYLAHVSGNMELLLITAAAIGGLFGFLRYNTHPATIFMGDSGSQFLGFAVGYLGLALIQPNGGDLSPWTILMLIGLPVADLAIVATRRLLRGANCFQADRTHLHHRFLALGFSQNEAVIIIYGIQASLVFFAVALRNSQDWTILLVYALHLLIVYGFLSHAERIHDDKLRTRRAGNGIDLGNNGPVHLRLVWTPRLILETIAPLILVLCAGLAVDVPRDFGFLGAALLLPLLIRVLRGNKPTTLLARIPTFIIAAASVYLYTEGRPFSSGLSLITEVLGFMTVAVAVVLALKFSPKRRAREFRTTAMDYLLVIVVVFAFFTNSGTANTFNNYFLIYLPIILYGCEVIMIERRKRREWLSLACVLAAAIITVRGFL